MIYLINYLLIPAICLYISGCSVAPTDVYVLRFQEGECSTKSKNMSIKVDSSNELSNIYIPIILNDHTLTSSNKYKLLRPIKELLEQEIKEMCGNIWIKEHSEKSNTNDSIEIYIKYFHIDRRKNVNPKKNLYVKIYLKHKEDIQILDQHCNFHTLNKILSDFFSQHIS